LIAAFCRCTRGPAMGPPNEGSQREEVMSMQRMVSPVTSSPVLNERVSAYEQGGNFRRAVTPTDPFRGTHVQKDAYMQSKMKYHRALARSSTHPSLPSSARMPMVVVDLLHPPAHVLPPNFFVWLPFGLDDTGQRGQSSIGFIFTVCNTMMGSTLMCLPWGFDKAGLAAGSLLTMCFGLVSFYTCSIILDWGAQPSRRFGDFSDLCATYLGNSSKNLATVTSIAILFGASATYHVLMATNLQEVIIALEDLIGIHTHIFCCGSGLFQYALTSLYVGVGLLPMLFIRDISKLAALGSYGVISLLYNVLFLVVSALINLHSNASGPSAHRGEVKMVGGIGDIGQFVGMIGLSLFLQSVLLPIASGHSQARTAPVAVKRDLGFAMGLTVLFYVTVGSVPAIAFQLGPNRTGQLPQNILQSYKMSSPFALIGKTLLVVQIGVVYPILTAVMRRQFFAGCMNREWPGWPRVAAFNVGMVLLTTLISSVYPKPGDVVGYVGAYTAVVYMLWLPILVHLKALKRSNRRTILSLLGNVLLATAGTCIVLLQFIA